MAGVRTSQRGSCTVTVPPVAGLRSTSIRAISQVSIGGSEVTDNRLSPPLQRVQVDLDLRGTLQPNRSVFSLRLTGEVDPLTNPIRPI